MIALDIVSARESCGALTCVPIEVAAADTHVGSCTLAHKGKLMRNSVEVQVVVVQSAANGKLVNETRWRAEGRVQRAPSEQTTGG